MERNQERSAKNVSLVASYSPLTYISGVVWNSTKKRQHYFDILKAFFVRHSSEYKTSDSDRKVNRNIYPDAVTRDRMRLIDPKSGQLEPIHHCLVEEL